MPPMLDYHKKAIKRGANKNNKPKEVKGIVKLLKKYQWFKELVLERTSNSIIPYLQLSKIDGMKRWEIFAKINDNK
jgi:hypothetical protein